MNPLLKLLIKSHKILIKKINNCNFGCESNDNNNSKLIIIKIYINPNYIPNNINYLLSSPLFIEF